MLKDRSKDIAVPNRYIDSYEYEARRPINESLVVVVGICPKKLRFDSNKVQRAPIVTWNNFDDLDLEGMVRKAMLQLVLMAYYSKMF